ncbi:MAG: hypothetical protein WA990_03420 [Rubrobacteraceae bacterium]
MTQSKTRGLLDPVRIGVIILTLATAGIHLYLFLIEGFPGNGEMAPVYQLLFLNIILIYVTLAAALIVPISPLPQIRPLTRVVLTAIAVSSIVSYYHVGVFDIVGRVDKIIEVLLILTVTASATLSGSDREFGGRFTRSVPGAIVQLVAGVAAGILMFLFLRPILV